jgi:hypothetical protein
MIADHFVVAAPQAHVPVAQHEAASAERVAETFVEVFAFAADLEVAVGVAAFLVAGRAKVPVVAAGLAEPWGRLRLGGQFENQVAVLRLFIGGQISIPVVARTTRSAPSAGQSRPHPTGILSPEINAAGVEMPLGADEIHIEVDKPPPVEP